LSQRNLRLRSQAAYRHLLETAETMDLRPLGETAETLLLQSAQGLPRTLNALLQRAMEQAAVANRRVVTSADVQLALDALPWLARARPT
jgi:type II secretory pathway predicted ATPase ExeA